MKKVKQVTLPISNRKIFNYLADFAFMVEDLPENKKKEFVEDIMNQLGSEAFLHSFTPSGEIGDNPQTPRIAESFYDSINDLVGVSGSVTKVLASNTNSDRVKKNREHRFKSSVVNLIQVYLETIFGMTTNDRPKQDRKTKRMRNTSFNYPELSGQKSDADYAKLNEVEMNRYVRLFVATIFFTTISELYLLKIKDMAKVIDELDILEVKGLNSPKKVYAQLRNPATRRKFIERVRNIWKLDLVAERDEGIVKKTKSKKKNLDQPEFMDLPEQDDK